MILKRVRVKNFRSCRDASIEAGGQVAIVGGNGTGKSTILRAIERFYGPSTSVEIDDFFGRQVGEPIEIALTFTSFNDVELEMFAPRIHNGEMTVVRVFEAGGGKGNGRYHGVTRQHLAFAGIRTAPNATSQRTLYNALRGQGGDYASLPAVARADQIPDALSGWEAEHDDQCELGKDDGQFFGFTNVAKGALQKATSFVFIPAVRDASADAVDSRGAVISRLLELVVRSAIQRRSDVRDFQQRISSEYRELTDPETLTELSNLSGELTDTLRHFYNEAAVALRWQPAQEFTVPLPAADVMLDDDGFEGPVDRKGHGLQRAFILTLLQHLAKATSQDAVREAVNEPEVTDATEAEVPATSDELVQGDQQSAEAPGETPPPFTLPGLILAIEEPELYQHPTKQRHFAKVLSQLSSGELTGVARQTQVLFATHSSLFVSTDRFEEVRLARRKKQPGTEHKECYVTSSDLDEIARKLERAYGKPEGTYTGDGLRGRLHIISSEIAEGFFAEMVVLVEGVSDRAAILAAADLEGIDLEALGIAVLWVDGKTKMDRPAAIFTSLGIPTFLIWDCDRRADGIHGAAQSKALQIIMGEDAAKVFESADVVSKTFACFDTKLELKLKQELGIEPYQQQLAIIKEKYEIEQNKDAEKAPFAMRELLAAAAAQGHRSATLRDIVQAIAALRATALDEATADQETAHAS